MNYTLHQLLVFTKVVQCQSITKASEELFMTQPAVSIQMKNFQDQFEIPLTEVIGRQLQITDFGMEIYGMANRILQEVHAINYKTMAYKGLLSGRLLIGVASTGKYVMPYFLSEFMHQNQGIDLVMDVTNKSKVVESLAKGSIEFALVSVLPDKLEVEEELIMDNELYFVSSKHFKKDKEKYSKEDLETQALIYREEGSATRKVMELYFEKKNIRARKKMELTSNEAVKQAVLAGLGISIMPVIGIRDELKRKSMVILPVAGLPIRTQWRLIWLKNKALSPVAQSYIRHLRENKKKIIQRFF
ncbi:MAG: LysR family transcriptional regulator [Cytophagaceae bacterium]|jgi:DNA-binding transcriptional LysR family regulator|nr:LysR family transcriptional regulator [Cytophagaceae bacterium]